MKNISTVLAGVLATEFVSFGVAKLAAVAPMRARAEHLGYTSTAYRAIGAAEVAAAAGLLLGVRRPMVGAAAGSGLALLMAGAVASHLRSGDGIAEFAPALGSGLAAVAFVAAVTGERS